MNSGNAGGYGYAGKGVATLKSALPNAGKGTARKVKVDVYKLGTSKINYPSKTSDIGRRPA
jgi:hypothetical protein